MSFMYAYKHREMLEAVQAMPIPALESPEITPPMRRHIERRRLMRMLNALAREPTEGELARLKAMIRQINPKISAEKHFIGMSGVPATHENVGALDLLGYGTLMPEGLQCHLARSLPPVIDTSGEAAARSATATPVIERRDSVLLVLPNNRVLAVDKVLLFDEGRRIMLDGTLCLRKITVTEEEHVRINTAWNPHQRDYLEYNAYADIDAFAAGIDITSDEHQARYDAHYEIVYAATTCLFAHSRQINIQHIERAALIQGLTETQIVQETTGAIKKRLELLRRAIEYAGGADQFRLTVFLNPHWRAKDARCFMRAIPSALHGVHITGVTFYPAEDEYMPLEINPRVLVFTSQQPTVIFAPTLLADAQQISAEGTLMHDTVHKNRLLLRARMHNEFVECAGQSVDGTICWHPLRVAAGVEQATRRDLYLTIRDSLDKLLSEEQLVMSIVTRQQAGGASARQKN